MTEEQAIDVLWDYHHVKHSLKKADLIFVLGSNDDRVASWAAELYKQGYADTVLFSGGAGRFTEGMAGTEAERFADTALHAGVPANAILTENESTNTGENVLFSRRLLEEHGLAPRTILALQKPYMERRTLATLEKQWPGVGITVSSPPLPFTEYITPELPKELVVSAMVGDFQRVVEYPKQGFATTQPVTEKALAAFHVLVRAGYDSQLLKNVPLP